MTSPEIKPDELQPAELLPAANTLRLCRRLLGRKHLFTPADSSAASYFITNKIPHRHAAQWKPVFWRGDNPKYAPESSVIAYATRSAVWSSFCLWLGDGVDQLLKNREIAKKRKSAERKARCRKRFRLKPKPPKEPLEEEKEVTGKVVLIRLQRAGFLKRSVQLDIEGEQYRWSGTRMFSTGGFRLGSMKGMSHSMKLVRLSDRALIATFEKGRWVSFKSQEKTGGPPNKKKSFIGTLRLYKPQQPQSAADPVRASRQAVLTTKIDAYIPKGKKETHEKDLNPEGHHSGNFLTDAIVLSAWIIVEAEHRLRWKIVDILEEIGENAEG